MKIKESSSKSKYSTSLVVFCIAAVILTVLRLVQIKTSIDASTGFYTKTGLSVIIFYALLFMSCLYFAVSSFISADSKNVTLCKKSQSMCIVTLAFSFFAFFDGALSFIKSIAATGDTQTASTVFKGLMISGAIPLFLQSIFAVISGIFLIELALSFKKGDGSASKHRIAALMPVGWISCRMLHLFVSKISFLRVSDLFLELSMCAFMILFFMALAQVSSNVYSNESRWRLVGFGLPAALISTLTSVSRLIFTFVSKETYINENHPFNIVDLAFSVFAVMLVVLLIKNGSAADEEEEKEIVS